ncbi:DNA/RNA helicase, superfamily II, SNF2 family protein [Nitzschia inconspicua]|uniref:DNA/RNA helicase, superfamily II, SNF2 family protein n=1 Tax=Nitzschia inconspicua TaxID=303405 RepID=A0A9K3M0Z6_9STRA|nr:DNA/RNA helicase, superfamily II, SNF2 family protein [Nitzschia inconspicua]
MNLSEERDDSMDIEKEEEEEGNKDPSNHNPNNDDSDDGSDSDDPRRRRSGRVRRQPERLGNQGKKTRKMKHRTSYAESEEEEDDEEDDENDDGNGLEGNDDDHDDNNDEDHEEEVPGGRRRSSRANKNTRSMKEPTDSVQDLLQGTSPTLLKPRNTSTTTSTTTNLKEKSTVPSSRRKRVSAATMSHDNDDDDDEPDRKLAAVVASSTSPPKVRGRHSKNRRQSKSVLEEVESGEDKTPDRDSLMDIDDDEYDNDDESEDHGDESEEEEDDDEDDETMKMQRILASRSETRKKWKEICGKMNSSEVTDGSRWFQGNMTTNADNDHDVDDEDIIEERFLVKWNGLSYLHVTWENQQDLLDLVDGAKTYMSTFFRKSTNGILFSQDERKDGDYFDPGFVEIDRILDVTPPDGYRGKLPSTWEEELAVDPIKEYGVVLDKTNTKAFDSGVGRQFLIKFTSLSYSEATYEFERDLILLDVDFRQKLKEYYERTRKPSRTEIKSRNDNAEEASRRAYVLFGDRSKLSSDEKAKKVAEYQQQLQDHVYENGGQLRDYQAEGVTWFLSNFVNDRSCIMADEMGLGKTLQTAAFVHLLVTRMHLPGPFLICVPLSTVAHWQREFVGWTGLNTIVYHGSAKDRERIRELEFAYQRDRPDSYGVNTKYLKKCEPAKKKGLPWMATVVVTTPEILVAEDWTELTFVHWQVLVVDEAHRLKNHNSKLAVNLRDDRFVFKHKLLLTGTPIQNEVKEFWTLLNFIDPENYDDINDFLEKYGDIKSKEKIDELHETIRPYILRRLKEDVEKSVPPKEETLIEVELTIAQKKYYRALYEKNVQFLHKNKKKALDGPSLNNLAMQLRKCCNHLFLLNGVEQDLREKEQEPFEEGDFVAKASGKLVLLDKLLPRLKENGHRVLLFSQFKIMLDIMEDYLYARKYKFERIDGSITGHLRQAAIDRYQDPNSSDPPFVMLLSTRAGGVGINLTSADTCIIYDSDWNPQNDIQAMARCHRIGQTKDVKVYRLLTRKTYEMQMFHLSSLKMGLDQAVLTGFESGATGDGGMTKEEVEKLLRHGAYDIFNEDKAGASERESNAFIEQDIDSILERRSRKIVHENTGTGSAAVGGTFSKASFVSKTPSKDSGQTATEDIDINDPDFWKKMVGESKPETESILKPRQRTKTNYNEKTWEKNFNKALTYDEDSGSDSSEGSEESEEDPDGADQERYRWGGNKPEHWKRNDAQGVIDGVERFGYGNKKWPDFIKELPKECSKFSETEIRRMTWSIVLTSICEVASSEAVGNAKRDKTMAQRKRGTDDNNGPEGVLAISNEMQSTSSVSESQRKQETFHKLWKKHEPWAKRALDDAMTYATQNEGRSMSAQSQQQEIVNGLFYSHLWPALQARQWRSDDDDEDVFVYQNQTFKSPSAVMNEVVRIHPELQNMVIPLLTKIEQARLQVTEHERSVRQKDLAITSENVDLKSLEGLLERYSPMQFVFDRKRKGNKLSLGRKVLSACLYEYAAFTLHDAAVGLQEKHDDDGDDYDIDYLSKVLIVDGRTALPHPLWTKQHDMTLIAGIMKHGWCEIDRNMKQMLSDSKLHWGYPFEITRSAPAQRIGRAQMQILKSTAERAASVLNDHSETLHVLSGFNKNLIIESFGLTHHDIEGTEPNVGGKEWRTDPSLLHQSSKKVDGTLDEPVDLPPKKDLVKRSRSILDKSIEVFRRSGLDALVAESEAAAKPKKEKKVTESYGYTVIDQSDRCNILLAELVRTLVKASPKHKKEMMSLWSVTINEATALEALLAPHEIEMKVEVAAMRKIVEQLKVAKLACKTAMRQGKNVLRCTIGEKPHPTRYDNEAQFPDANALLSAAEKKGAVKKRVWKNDPSLGERAILNAVKKISKRNSEIVGPVCRFDNYQEDTSGIPLTMMEVWILTIFCTMGVPAGSSSNGKSSNLTSPLTWADVAKALEVMARQQLTNAEDFVKDCEDAVAKAKDQGHKAETIAALEAKVSLAKSEQAARHHAAATTADVITDPVGILGKKSALLLERVRQYAGFEQGSKVSKATHKYENFLGPKILGWIWKQMKEFAVENCIIGDDGKILGNITYDLMKDHPDKVGDIAVSAVLDKKSARDVFSQTAMMTRLRSILLRNSEEELRGKLARAIKSSKKLEDPWEKQPDWWDDTTVQHSLVLLQRLNEFGFLWIMDMEKARDGFGAPDMDYNDMIDMQLTKPSIQIKANQLVRELNAIEDHEDLMHMLQRRKSRSSMDSLAGCNGNASVESSETKKKKKTQVQAGLRAFFTADAKQQSSGKQSSLGDSKDKAKSSLPSPKHADENSLNGNSAGAACGGGSPDSLASVGKRKQSPTPVEEDSKASSIEKKAKLSADE